MLMIMILAMVKHQLSIRMAATHLKLLMRVSMVTSNNLIGELIVLKGVGNPLDRGASINR